MALVYPRLHGLPRRRLQLVAEGSQRVVAIQRCTVTERAAPSHGL